MTFLDDLLQRYARADNAIGPATLLAVASQHVVSLEPALVATRGPLRSEGLRLCSRFAEFAGWLSQDAGDLDAAQRWTDRALDFTEELDDHEARAYVLMRKSGIAADRREPARCVTLAVAASHRAAEQAPRLRALTLRQAAIAQAIVGDRRASDLAAGQALEAAGAADTATDDFAYATEAYVTMETGVSSFHLQRHDEAAERLARAAGAWPTGFARDRGLCLARLAVVEATRGNVDVACAVGRDAVSVTRTADSARTRATLLSLKQRLAPYDRVGFVSEFNRELTQFG